MTQLPHVTFDDPIPLRPGPAPVPRESAPLPIPLTSLVGRSNENSAAGKMLRRPDVRILTISGPAGVGKTRIALQVARDASGDFSDGVFWIDLAQVRDAARVPDAVAAALQLEDKPDHPIAETMRTLLLSRCVLLVLDNFEHLFDAGPLITEWLTTCPRLTFLTTGRMLLTDLSALFTELGPSPAAITRSTPNGLTRRELDVVQLLAQGKSNRDIANTLFVSQNTAITHVHHVMTKLELDSRAAVAAWAVRNGFD